MCLEFRPQCTMEHHWINIVGNRRVSSEPPVVFQRSSIGLPVCSNYANYHRVATGTPMGASISQYGSSDIPVYLCGFPVCPNCANGEFWIATRRPLGNSNSQCGSSIVQWYPSVPTESGFEVIIKSGHFPACNPLCIKLVWRELFALS